MKQATVQAIDALADHWAEVDRIRVARGIDVDKPVPKGAFTATEYAERYKIAATTALAQLLRFTREGVFAKGRATVLDTRGRAQARTVYWPAK